MLFDGPHLLYIFISLILTILILYLATKYIKKFKHKEWFLKFWAVLTVFLHWLPLWVSHLQGQDAIAANNQLFPIYFCNMSMYLLVITAFWGDKKSKSFHYLSVITCYAGALGALISLFYPEYYLGSGNIFELGVIKSMLSHSTMLIGSLYLMTGKYFKVKLKDNVIIYGVGLLGFGVIGLAVNGLFALVGLPQPNAMFLQKPPIEEVPFLNVFVIALLMMLVVAGISYTIEYLETKRTAKEKVTAST